MPFTFAHPAIVLPLARLPRRFVSVTGLVVGAIVPDFEYFLRLRLRSAHSHTITGLFYFNVPVGLLLALLFHLFVRDIVVGNLPRAFRQRLAALTGYSWPTYFVRHWFVVVMSLLTGAFSHLLWDSFTHPGGWFVQLLPGLGQKISFGDVVLPLYRVVQHASTLAGFAVIASCVSRLPKTVQQGAAPQTCYWPLVAMVALLAFGVRMLLPFHSFSDLVVSGIAALLLALLVVSFGYTLRRGRPVSDNTDIYR